MDNQILNAYSEIDTMISNLEEQRKSLSLLSDSSFPNSEKWKIICGVTTKNKEEMSIAFLRNVFPNADKYVYIGETANIFFGKVVVKIFTYAPYNIHLEYIGVIRKKYPELIEPSEFEDFYSRFFEAKEKGASKDALARYLFPKCGYVVRHIKYFFAKKNFGYLESECKRLKNERYAQSHSQLNEYNDYQNEVGKFEACYLSLVKNFANKEMKIDRTTYF